MNIPKKALFLLILPVVILVIAIPLAASPKVSSERQKLIDYALELRGTKYTYAGRTPKTGFDCSGFVSYSLKNALDISVSPQSSAIYAQTEHINDEEKEPGDLVFFAVTSSDGKKRINHVGIYLGMYNGEGSLNGKRVFVHAASDGPRTGVIVSSLDEKYWSSHLYGYGRLLPKSL